ncbi:hypothetical protein [Tellurirhabdus bombi]|uniref:hypothetical protein n=1 Tax=Tellurirhabdus bombi TaxID=2907205 RepID=UPI001F27EEBE|nr:hypothetical protein [Tellurirhabdus bombi]
MYYHEVTYIIGEQFPIANINPGKEQLMLITNTEFLTLAFFSESIEQDMAYWPSNSMAVGLYSNVEQVPFLLLTFPDQDAAFSHSLNVYRMSGDDRGPWLRDHDKKTITVALINAETGTLQAMRQIEVHWAGILRKIVRQQLMTYSGYEQVEVTVMHMSNTISLLAMFETAKRLNWLDVQVPMLKAAEEPEQETSTE